MNDITDDVLYKAIEEYILQSPAPGLETGTTTTPRMMERFKIGRVKANRILRGLIDDGTIVRDKVSFVDGWSNKSHVSGFRWVNGKE